MIDLDDLPKDLYIGGEWCASNDGARIDVLNPADEQLLTSVQSASVEDCLRAVAAADAAQGDWAATSPRHKAEVLRKTFELLEAQRENFAQVISLEEGKTFAEAMGEMAYAAEFFRWYAEEAPRIYGEVSRSPAGANNILVLKKPIGVALLVTPWNFPAAMAARKIAPALAAGCTAILKPASETPLTALLMAQVLEEAGVPAGVVNVVPSRHSSTVVPAMLRDGRVRKLSFTGSTEVGRILMAEASQSIINCSMELGGNAPFIVLEDADLDKAVAGALVAKIRNAGESCIGANRFYVHAAVIETFSEKFAEAMGKLKVGVGLEEGIDVGPLVNAATRNKVKELVDDAVAQGARLMTGGQSRFDTGFFYEPTVLVDVPSDAKILQEEIFGPVAPIVAFEDVEEVIALANNTEFGLAAYVFGQNIGNALSVIQRIDAGVTGINQGFISDPAAPFGGLKQSGIGREGSHVGLEEFCETQYVAVDW